MTQENYIRNYEPADREAVRRIAYQTSFRDHPEAFLTDQEIVADALTRYFTDHEPGSCFVAVRQGKVVGYIIGTRNVKTMNRVFNLKILPQLCLKMIQRGMIFNRQFLRLLAGAMAGFIRGEFFYPDYGKTYPGLLHINLEKDARNLGLGRKLIEHFETYLKDHNVKGLYLGTMSERAKEFFMKNGYKVLFASQRAYLEYGMKERVPVYIMGKSFCHE